MLRALLNKLWLFLALLLVAIAVVVSLGRLMLPELPKYRAELERLAGEQLGVPVRIQELEAHWALSGPVLRLRGVSLPDPQGRPQLSLATLDLALDIWRSALLAKPVARRFEIAGADARLDKAADGSWRVRGLPAGGEDTPLDTVLDTLFEQRFLSVRDSRIELHQAGKPVLPIALRELSLNNSTLMHQLAGEAFLVGGEGGSFRFVVESQGDPRRDDTRSRVYLASSGHGLPSMPLPRLEGYSLARAELEGELWAERLGPRWLKAQLRFHGQELRVEKNEAEVLALAETSGRLRWQAQTEGWRLVAQDLSLRTEAGAWQPFDLRLEREGTEQWRLALSRLDLARVARLAERLPLTAETQAQLKALAPEGELRGLQLAWRAPADTASWQASAELAGASWRAHARIPAVQGLHARLSASETGGVAVVDGASGLALPVLFREPFVLKELKAGAAWTTGPEGWELSVSGARLATEDARVRARMVYTQAAGSGAELGLYAELFEGRSDHAGRYFPVSLMGEDLVHYLDQGVGPGGRIPYAHIAMRGPLSAFPFENPEGVFSIAARAEDVPFRFQDDWPVLEHTSADLYFEGDSMRIVADRGELKGLSARFAEARIPVLSADRPVLLLKAEAQGPAAGLSAVVRESPLPGLLGEDLARLDFSGQSGLDLSLELPLQDPKGIKLDGRLRLSDSRLDVRPLGTLLTGLNGELKFSERAVSSKGMQGRILGEPLRLDLAQRSSKAGEVLEISARGAMSAKALQSAGLPLAERLSGQTRYTAVLAIVPDAPEQQSGLHLSLMSDLKGLKADLPAPLGLDGGGRVLGLELDLGADTTLTARYGEVLGAVARWQVDEQVNARFDRAALVAGKGKAVLPQGPGVVVSGALDSLSVGPWVDTVRTLFPATTTVVGASFRGLALEVAQLDLYGVAVHAAELELTPSPDGLAISLDSKEIVGKLLLPQDAARQALVLDLERVHLPKPVEDKSKVPEPMDLPVQPADLPRMIITCQDCRYGELILGQMRLVTQPVSGGLDIREFKLKSASTDLAMTGRWLGGTQERTELRGQLRVPEIGRFAKDWGLGGSARESLLAADFELSWAGDPAQFAWPTTRGFLNGRLSPGHLEDVSDKGARVLSLFSLQTLRRRLTLDFSDVFQKGFYYNSISGGFRIENGVAMTENTRIDGLAADIEITGRTDLVHKSFDQKVRVIPELSSSLPLLAGWAVEPTMALIVLALNTVLQPAIDVITRVDYRVTGAWDAPVIEEIGKTKGKVKVAPESVLSPDLAEPTKQEQP